MENTKATIKPDQKIKYDQTKSDVSSAQYVFLTILDVLLKVSHEFSAVFYTSLYYTIHEHIIYM